MIQVFTRSRSEELYNMMREFIPYHIECVRCTGFDDWWEANDYLYHIIQEGKDWVVNLDEDAFVTDWKSIEQLITTMMYFKHEYCGHPDCGSVISHRRNWPVVMNPFFNIFDTKSIREKIYPRTVASNLTFQPYMTKYYPEFVPETEEGGDIEPFNGFFYGLAYMFHPAYLRTRMHPDGISTISLDNRSRPFLYHSWYSREFETDPIQRERILKIYEEAKRDKNEYRLVHNNPL